MYAGSQRIAMVDATGKVYYYLNDHLGSAAVVIDSAVGHPNLGHPARLSMRFRYTDLPLHSPVTGEAHRR